MKQPATEFRNLAFPLPLAARGALVDCDPGDETADAVSALTRAVVENFQAPGEETTGESDLPRQAPRLPDGF